MEKDRDNPSEQKEYQFTLKCQNCGNPISLAAKDARQSDARTNTITIANLTAHCCQKPNYH